MRKREMYRRLGMPVAGRLAGLPPLEEGVEILKPKGTHDSKSFSWTAGRLSVSAMVRHGKDRDECQDVAAVSASSKLIIAGVFDGYGRGGERYSEAMAYEVLSQGYGSRVQLLDEPDAGELLMYAASAVEGMRGGKTGGGTTAAVALLLPDGRYSLAGVGDAAAYLIGPGGACQVLGGGRAISSPSARDGEVEVSDVGSLYLLPDQYARARHTLSAAITRDGIVGVGMGAHGGVLERGRKIVLVTDGVTKNLRMAVDRDGYITDASGCLDIGEAAKGAGKRGRKAKDILRAINEMVEARAARGVEGFVPGPKGNMALWTDGDDVSIVVLALE